MASSNDWQTGTAIALSYSPLIQVRHASPVAVLLTQELAAFSAVSHVDGGGGGGGGGVMSSGGLRPQSKLEQPSPEPTPAAHPK